ncbi:Uncharacterised protein [uncultured archaeon]|nr:Uncharacterised protein [uncultured archaeon]
MSIKDKIKEFKNSQNYWIGLLRDFLFVISVVAIFASVSYISLGRWSPAVAVESESMSPHMQVGDIIFVQSIDRTQIITYNKGKQIDYKTFDNYGDVILYKKCGKEGVTPIIHRAMAYVETGEPMWSGGPPAPYSGYITKGDNNNLLDVQWNICHGQPGNTSEGRPVKKEWVIGAARFYRVPILGYITFIPRKTLGI